MELEAKRVLDRITGNELIGPLFSSPFILLFARGNMLYEFKAESRFKLVPSFKIGEVVRLNGYVRELSSGKGENYT